MITLSDRLMAVAKTAAPCGVIADIGCDHCLTLMWLIENGICARGIGVEVKPGPLEKARENIINFGFTALIELRLGNGLEPIKSGESETIIISGMGGLTINSILERGLFASKSASQLILQPQGHIPNVRRRLHALGFEIKSENMVSDNGKYYNIIEAEPCITVMPYANEYDYAFGRELIKANNPVLKRFLFERLSHNKSIIDGLTEKNIDKRIEIENENILIQEALQCL